MKKSLFLMLCLLLLLTGCGVGIDEPLKPTASPVETAKAELSEEKPTIASEIQTEHDEYDYELIFPSDRYPETALHIHGAIAQGYTDVCTIDRAGAVENRKKSLAGIETREGYDRDEWPMAMCAEGGVGASVAYIDSSDNRGAGSWVGNQLEDYPDGTRILFIVEKPKNLFPSQPVATTKPTQKPTKEPEVTQRPRKKSVAPEKPSATPSAPTDDENVLYANCAAVRAAGKAPLYKGEPGYSKKLDRDGDGVACET